MPLDNAILRSLVTQARTITVDALAAAEAEVLIEQAELSDVQGDLAQFQAEAAADLAELQTGNALELAQIQTVHDAELANLQAAVTAFQTQAASELAAAQAANDAEVLSLQAEIDAGLAPLQAAVTSAEDELFVAETDRDDFATQLAYLDELLYLIPEEDEEDPDPELPVNPLKPTLVDPLVIALLPSGNPSVIQAGIRDVRLVWPNEPVTDDSIEIRGGRHIHCIGGHFKPMGDSDNNTALKFRDQITGGVTYLERMLIDITDRRYQNDWMHSDPVTIDSVDNTGDAIQFGGVIHATNPSYPDFVMVKSIIKGVSGQDPSGCEKCTGAHADGFETVGPTGKVTFKDVHVYSNYQGIFAAPALNFYGQVLEPHEQNLNGVHFDNVTCTVVEPPNLSTTDQDKWRFRAVGYYLEGHNLRVAGKQSYWDLSVGPGGIYLDTPSTETQNWLNFIGGKTVLHTEVTPQTNPRTATFTSGGTPFDYIPGAILTQGVSPNAPTLAEVGPGSPAIYQ